ncbi:MAG: 6-carboxytetrahydropterin synthase QueD [Methanotrichaceae archaeon]|nr:6-carboxytetrahydropterin synthase QueD [Methanotrichaceae archaeon]
MKIGLEAEFDSAHHLPRYEGSCARVHGHTYKVEAVFEGDVEEESGMVVDFYRLKALMGSALERLDHHDLNDVMPNPTAERIAQYIWEEISGRLEGESLRLVSIKLWEGRGKWVMID